MGLRQWPGAKASVFISVLNKDLDLWSMVLNNYMMLCLFIDQS